MPPVKRNQTRATPADPSLSFVGRANEVAQFRDSVRYLLGAAPKPTDRIFTHIFIAHGEGGMGKSTLLRRWQQVAVEEGVPAERVITIPLDGRIYPDADALASVIRAAVAARFPGF